MRQCGEEFILESYGFFGCSQRLLLVCTSLALVPRRRRVPDRDSDGVRQPAIVGWRLDDVVGEAGSKAGRGHFLTPGVGEHHDGSVDPPLPDLLKYLQAVRPSQLVVRDDRVERGALQSGGEIRAVAGFGQYQVGKLRGKPAFRQKPILRTIVNDEDDVSASATIEPRPLVQH